ncbi:MAG: hypothetical protein VXZ38_00540, partial [Planctomycetota bacterium]|nr:hypothetical protein [Planctomycetota bacterium]
MSRVSLITLTLVLNLFSLVKRAESTEILWSQYCQNANTMKVLVHLDLDPTDSINKIEKVELWIRDPADTDWEHLQTCEADHLTATALFELPNWPRHTEKKFRVTTGQAQWEGTFRAEPKTHDGLRLAGLSCHKDIGWPWTEAIAEVISHDPDMVFFSGDQIYENDYNSPMFRAQSLEEVPKGMKNYLEKYRKFG